MVTEFGSSIDYEDLWIIIWRPRPNGCYFADNIIALTLIFLNESDWILNVIMLECVGSVLVLIPAWYQTGDKPVSELMMA